MGLSGLHPLNQTHNDQHEDPIFQSTTRVKPFICTMPMRLDEGWNQIQFNLDNFTSRAYQTVYIETLRVQIHASCRIRRIFFSNRLYSDEELPPEFKIWLPENRAKLKQDQQQGGPGDQMMQEDGGQAIEEDANEAPQD